MQSLTKSIISNVDKLMRCSSINSSLNDRPTTIQQEKLFCSATVKNILTVFVKCLAQVRLLTAFDLRSMCTLQMKGLN
jgi:hypothetical protein